MDKSDDTSSRARALLKQLRDENPNWTKDQIFKEWSKIVRQDEELTREVEEATWKDMWERTGKRFQN